MFKSLTKAKRQQINVYDKKLAFIYDLKNFKKFVLTG
jgi:hypothetical protein